MSLAEHRFRIWLRRRLRPHSLHDRFTNIFAKRFLDGQLIVVKQLPAGAIVDSRKVGK